jgi:hypothetical protein
VLPIRVRRTCGSFRHELKSKLRSYSNLIYQKKINLRKVKVSLECSMFWGFQIYDSQRLGPNTKSGNGFESEIKSWLLCRADRRRAPCDPGNQIQNWGHDESHSGSVEVCLLHNSKRQRKLTTFSTLQVIQYSSFFVEKICKRLSL